LARSNGSTGEVEIFIPDSTDQHLTNGHQRQLQTAKNKGIKIFLAYSEKVGTPSANKKASSFFAPRKIQASARRPFSFLKTGCSERPEEVE
jgi:hypothetical protein